MSIAQPKVIRNSTLKIEHNGDPVPPDFAPALNFQAAIHHTCVNSAGTHNPAIHDLPQPSPDAQAFAEPASVSAAIAAKASGWPAFPRFFAREYS